MASVSAWVPPVLREFTGYMLHPRWREPVGLRAPGAARDLAIMIGVLALVLIAIILPLISAWKDAMSLPSPDAFGQIDATYLPWLAVLVAPVLEEAAFRGWLIGKPRALWLLTCLVAILGVLFLRYFGFPGKVLIAAMVAIALLGVAGFWLLRRQQASPGYRRRFPVIFWATAFVFAGVHLANYPQITPALVPLVLPQLYAGLALGFVRMRIGLPASMIAHATSNGIALALATWVSG